MKVGYSIVSGVDVKITNYSQYIGIVLLSVGCGMGSDPSNNDDRSSDSFHSRQVLAEKNKEKIIEKNRNQLRINYLEEIRNINDPDQISKIDSKYKRLRRMFDDEVALFLKKPVNDGVLEQLDGEIDYDKPYAWPFNSVYHPLVQREVQKVTRDFGSLYISETLGRDGSIRGKEVAAKVPWSAYWYPFRDRRLYDSEQGVLVKYDRLIASAGGRSRIADEERKTYGFYNADGWEGLCDAWALASVTTPEPSKPKTIYGINFSISDQKALAIFSHSKFPFKQYGITYRGDADTDGTYQDLKPEAFHKIVVSVIGKEKRALIIDETPGTEVWNKPLYRYRWQVTKDPKVDAAYLVKAFPLLINQRTFVSDKPTNIDDTIAPIYEYRLYVDKNTVGNGGYLVVAGQWLKNSRKYHPGNVKYPIMKGPLKSHNKEFNKYLPIYQRLF